MSFLPKNILTAAAGIALAVGISSQAFASQQLTWDASKTVPGLTSTSAQVSFYDMIVADYATIDIKANQTFTETSYLSIAGLTDQSGSILSGTDAPLFNQLNGGYGLYYAVNATGTLATNKFTSLSFTLYGYSIPGTTKASFPFASNTANPTPSIPGTQIALATGSLIFNGDNSASINSAGVPTATADVTFIPSTAANASGFFVSPTSAVALELFTGFTNTASQFSVTTSGTDTIYQIGNTNVGKNPGGGSADAVILPVPEPASLAILGIGLVGFGMFRRGRKQG